MNRISMEEFEMANGILNGMPDACIKLDASSTIVFVNQAAEELFSKSKRNILGKYLWEIYPEAIYAPGVEAINHALTQNRSSQITYFSDFFKTMISLRATAVRSGALILLHKKNERNINPELPAYASASDHKEAQTHLSVKKNEAAGDNYGTRHSRAIHKLRNLTRKQKKKLLENEAAIKRRDEFIGIASHELKTPITSIKGFTQLLLQSYKSGNDAFIYSALQSVNLQTDQLIRLINHFLDVAKIDTDHFQVNMETFDFIAMVRETIAFLTPTTTHSIVFRADGELLIEGDPERLRQVIQNLLTNAIKYSPAAKEVLVNVEILPGSVIFSVTDYGIGMEAGYLKKIFERFYRIKDPARDDHGGLGIGLYVAAEIIKRHQGKIWAESSAGMGSVFHFSVPVTQGKEI